MNLTFQREEIHRMIYHFGLALLVCCLPLSRYLLSISQFILLLNWIAEGNFRNKIASLRHNTSILLFASVFILYVAGYLFSENKISGLDKVINTLPLLMMPIVMGTSQALTENTAKKLMWLFVAAVTAASLISIISYMMKGLPDGGDYRRISIFVPHIRFALLINMAIAILLYQILFGHPGNSGSRLSFMGMTGIACTLYLAGFLFFMRSATGIVIFGILVLLFTLNLTSRLKRNSLRFLALTFIALFSMALPGLIVYTWIRNFKPEAVDWTSLESHTANGNPYYHDTVSVILENGHYQGIYICEPELRREWNRRSTITYDGKDLKGQNLSSTLQRYLTSKGLRKDSAAVHSLGAADLKNIEKGLANYKFRENAGISQRLYETLWEIHIYRHSGYAQQHTFGQRILFSKVAFSLMREKLWTGRGSGDVNNSMYQKALLSNLAIDPKWEGKPHNQFAFFILAFGVFGFLWVLVCWIYPVIYTKAYRMLLFNAFSIIILISMVIIDTMESYDSIVFFAFFYCLFIYRDRNKKA